MKSPFFKTALRGVLFLIPILGVGYLFTQLFKTIQKYSEQIIESTPLHTHWQVFWAALIALFIIALMAYIAGRISQSKWVLRLSETIDEQLLNMSPAYRKFKLNLDNQARFLVENRPPIFVAFADKERPGFLIDEHADQGKAVVFIPKNFNDYNGNVYIVPLSDIRYAKSNAEDFVYALDHVGDGMDIS